MAECTRFRLRYLYWTNINHRNATIERSRLDGTDRRVIVHEKLFLPLAVAVDVEENRVYWSEEHEDIYYTIASSDLDGGSRRTVNHGTHQRPFSIALDDQYVYWSDWTGNAVWSWPKNGSTPDALSMVAKYKTIYSPMGLFTRTGNTSSVNETVCAMNRAQVCLFNITLRALFRHGLRNVRGREKKRWASGVCRGGGAIWAMARIVKCQDR